MWKETYFFRMFNYDAGIHTKGAYIRAVKRKKKYIYIYIYMFKKEKKKKKKKNIDGINETS